MPELPDALTRKVGPFPVIGWLGIGAAGIGVAVVIRRSDLFGGSGTVAPVDELQELGDPALGGEVYAGGGTVPIAPQAQPGSTGYTPAPITTNGEWVRRGVAWAIEQGISPTLASSALSKYVEPGEDALTWQEGDVLDKVLRALGAPPEGAPAPNIAPHPGPVRPPVAVLPGTPPTIPPKGAPKPPKPAPTQPRPKVKRYTVKRGDNLSKIAVLVYKNAAAWPYIYNANRALIGPDPDLIRPGQVLVIP